MFKLAITLVGAFAVGGALILPSDSQFVEVDKKYFVSQVAVSFFEAVVTCKQYGYKLATVLSDQENLLLNTTVPLGGSTHYWLGGVNANNEHDIFGKKWIWLESANDIIFLNWDDGQPIMENGINCIALYGNGKWISHACEDYKFGFVCELS